MTVHTYEELYEHVGHNVVVVTYGNPPENVAVECEDCGTVLMDFDNVEDAYYEVVLSDGGNEQTIVYGGHDQETALHLFTHYRDQTRSGHGLTKELPIVLFYENGEETKEYLPWTDKKTSKKRLEELKR